MEICNDGKNALKRALVNQSELAANYVPRIAMALTLDCLLCVLASKTYARGRICRKSLRMKSKSRLRSVSINCRDFDVSNLCRLVSLLCLLCPFNETSGFVCASIRLSPSHPGTMCSSVSPPPDIFCVGGLIPNVHPEHDRSRRSQKTRNTERISRATSQSARFVVKKREYRSFAEV